MNYTSLSPSENLWVSMNSRIEEEFGLGDVRHTLMINLNLSEDSEYRMTNSKFRLIILVHASYMDLGSWCEPPTAIRGPRHLASPVAGDPKNDRPIFDLPLLLSDRQKFRLISLPYQLYREAPDTFCVLHNQVYPLSPVTLSFRANGVFAERMARFSPEWESAVTHYYISISSTSSRRPTATALPSHILRQITEHTIGLDAGTYLSLHSVKLVLSCSLVSKAWLPVRDIIWDIKLGRCPIPNLCALEKTMGRRPHLADMLKYMPRSEFLSKLRPFDYSDCRDIPLWDERASAFDGLARHCTNLQEVSITGDMLPRMQNSLAALRNVKRLKVWREYASAIPILLQDLLETIKEWASLETLIFKHWSNDLAAELEGIAPYSLYELRLDSGTISGNQLSYIVSNPICRLYSLKLSYITTTNADLRTFLSVVALTIEDIQISDCGIDLPPQNEGRAIDSIISKMSNLQEMRVPATIITTKGIAEKTGTGHWTKIRVDFRGMEELIAFRFTTHFIEATLLTGWDEILLKLPYFEHREHLSPFSGAAFVAQQVAAYREIVLNISLSN